MTLENNDETQIQQLINDWTSALCVKDIDRMMIKGVTEWRRTWEQCLPYFPESFQVETRDMIINVSGDTAFAHWVSRFTGMPKDHPAGQTWMRATVGYKRQNGRWFIAHEHVSFPLNPETSQIVLTPDI
ncbi:unnamed protein product [Rotaria magnacalcarata]|uniref:SnoaL-like domain-containing protein n=2 Tax=Rotaria magnacalcarata TaxID=392030 RepID=A0A816W7C4_9BILA|nr:unnamed protein product [Rotaria magnacalcarata]CAF2207916.1 unnamed protein product [Rotaria magnacalcarata]CAF4161215.1 unnamed protein product [Rotaria magnacalcarata]CAF4162436.1 unnamed protein product [Rotaria magnacalcarata]CAF4694365.1 unnamed protein product [Rotaria magnacalcarata]